MSEQMPRRRRRADRPKPKLVRKLEARRDAYREQGAIYRAAWVTAGFLVTLAGLVMLLLPGPAFVVIPIGLAMLSLQFAWAASLLDRALVQAQAAQEKAANTTTRQRVVTGVAVACAVGAAVAAALVYDIPLLPV